MKTIAIDFDGVIHAYTKGWQDGSIYDPAIEGSFESIEHFFKNDFSVFIFSTRSAKQIKKWVEFELSKLSHLSTMKVEAISSDVVFWNKPWVIGITNIKLPAMMYIDDRAIKFEGSWFNTIQDVENFKTYQEYNDHAPDKK